jgi:hypothetical protein
MTRRQLQEAIESPLETVGAAIHHTVLQQILNDCDEEPDHLPVLQHLLKRMLEEGGFGVPSGTGPTRLEEDSPSENG